MPLDSIPHNFATGRLEDLVRWARRNSVFLARFGMEVFRASPRQADLMIVAGRVSQKMAPVLRQVYDQMVEPKWVISMGVCASSGGMFNNYAIVQGVDQVVPVDVYVPGCPPGPETLMHGILMLHEQIKTGELLKRRESSTTGGAGIEVVQRDGVPFTPIGTDPARGSAPQPVADATASEAQSA
jgi:NADH-quinone oxidoreductase subunit B